jgi:hypothetical protein
MTSGHYQIGSIYCITGPSAGKNFLKRRKKKSGIDKTKNPQQGRGEKFDPSWDDSLQIA